VLAIDVQALQAQWDDRLMTRETGLALCEAGPCYTVLTPAGRIIALGGFSETHAGYAVAWSLLSGDIGRHHIELTRMARFGLDDAPYARIEALVRPEHVAGLRWAAVLGFEQAFRVRCARPDGGDLELFERVRS